MWTFLLRLLDSIAVCSLVDARASIPARLFFLIALFLYVCACWNVSPVTSTLYTAAHSVHIIFVSFSTFEHNGTKRNEARTTATTKTSICFSIVGFNSLCLLETNVCAWQRDDKKKIWSLIWPIGRLPWKISWNQCADLNALHQMEIKKKK